MKTIGLLGGMSWESTVTYYQVINREVQKKLGGLHSAKCLLYSVDFDEIERCQTAGEWEKAGEILAQAALNLEKAGAEGIALCTNTMHKVAPQIEAKISVPFLHIAQVTAAEIKKQNLTCVGLLGTKYTMEQNFYKECIKEQGVEVLIPKEEQRSEVNRIIFEELCRGNVEENSRQYMQEVVSDLVQQGVQGVILGCTEIGLLVQQKNVETVLFDTALLHAKAAAEFVCSAR